MLNFHVLEDLLHVSPNWRNTGPRHDSVMLRGNRQDSIWFAQIYEMFTVTVRGNVIPVGLVNMFRNYRHHQHSENLQAQDAGRYEFISLQSIIHACHILPPTMSNTRNTIQDLADMDYLLRLLPV